MQAYKGFLHTSVLKHVTDDNINQINVLGYIAAYRLSLPAVSKNLEEFYTSCQIILAEH